MNYIIAVGIFQALLAIALLSLGKSKRPADSLLLWLMICIATHLSIKFFIFTSVEYHEIKKQLNTFIGLAYGPLLWLYAKKAGNDQFLPYKHLAVFIPTLLAAICYLAIVFQIVSTGKEPTVIINYYNNITVLIMPAILLLFAFMAVKQALKLSRFWIAEKKLILRIAALFITMAVISFASLTFSFFDPVYEGHFLSIRVIVYFILLVICVLIWQYRVALQAVLTKEPETVALPITEIVKITEEAPPAPTGDPAKYREVISALDQLMREKKLYTDAELTMEKLSHESRLSRHSISEALNQYAGKSFYAYVNDFRVMEMIRHLDRCKLQDITPNMLVLAYEAGFKSKSSFNKYFKQVTGVTPSMYLHKDTVVHPLFSTHDTATA